MRQDDTQVIELLYHPDKRMPACALIQPLAGLAANNDILHLWDEWLTFPHEGMKRYRGTLGEWRQIAQQDNDYHQEKAS